MVANRKLPDQDGDAVAWEPPAEVEYLWREILHEEPHECPWKFACAMAKMRYISRSQVWHVAEWADRMSQGLRRLQLREIARDIQAIAKQLA